MSDIELHKGIIKKIDTEGLSVEDWVKQYIDKYAKENPNSWIARHINDSEFDYKQEFLDITWDQNYIITKNYIFKAYDEMLYGDFVDIHKNANGTYSYRTQFYNGGTCLTEMLEEGLKEIKIFDNSDTLYDET